MKNKILFLVQLPPPIHGSSIANQAIYYSECINSKYTCSYHNISLSSDMGDLGRLKFKKIMKLVSTFAGAFKRAYVVDYDLVYISLSPIGVPFLKDFLILAIASKLFRKKIIIHLHGKGIKKQEENWFFSLLYRVVFKNSKLIQLSPMLYYDVAKFKKKEDITFIPNGVTIPKYSKNKIHGKVKFLYLSNFMREKGALELLRACWSLRDRIEDFEIVFAGKFVEPDFKTQFLNELNALKLPNVSVIEGVYGDEKIALLKESNVFCLPTYYKNECFPISILEAMSYSNAVISTDEGAITGIVRDQLDGLIVKKKDVDALRQAMVKMMNEPCFLSECGLRAYERCKKEYSITAFEENIGSVIDLALEGKND